MLKHSITGPTLPSRRIERRKTIDVIQDEFESIIAGNQDENKGKQNEK